MILNQFTIAEYVRVNKFDARRSFKGKYDKVRYSYWQLAIDNNRVSLQLIFECQGPDGVCEDCFSVAL